MRLVDVRYIRLLNYCVHLTHTHPLTTCTQLASHSQLRPLFLINWQIWCIGYYILCLISVGMTTLVVVVVDNPVVSVETLLDEDQSLNPAEGNLEFFSVKCRLKVRKQQSI